MRCEAARHGDHSVRLGMALGGALLAGALLGACDSGSGSGSGSGDRPPSTTSTGGASSTAVAVPTVRSGPPVGLKEVAQGSGSAMLTDDLLVELSGSGQCVLTARPLATPDMQKWRIVGKIDGVDLRCTPGSPALADSTLVLPYDTTTTGAGIEADSSEQGVVGLDFDGTQRWRTPITGIDTVVGTSGRFVLVTDKRALPTVPDEKRLTAVVDATTGKVLWRQSGRTARGIEGDTVLVSDHEDAYDKVTGLDAATGQPRWTHATASAADLAVTGANVVALPKAADPNDIGDLLGFTVDLELIDAKSGTVLYTESGATSFPTCVSDGRTAVVCQTYGGAEKSRHVFAYDLTSRKRSWTIAAKAVSDAGVELRSMVDGRVFFDTKTGGALVDAGTGKQLAHNLPGAPDLLRGAYGVDNSRLGYEVFLITS